MTACLLAGLWAADAPAQDVGSPISAIDWLSDVIQTPPALPEEGVADDAGTEEISVVPLEDLALDGVGLLPRSVTGLPRDFWGSSPSATLANLMRLQQTSLPMPARRLLKRVLLAELDPPIDASPEHTLFLARIDTLLAFGALPDAQALVERAGPTDDVEVFRRWFDISLLRGDENRACAAMKAAPDIAPTFTARIFCLARNNDWSAAALSLETANALGYVTPAERELMARFLDPELFEGVPMAPAPEPLTPLNYKMLAALAEAPPASTLPLAFNHALLSPVSGWKARLEAGERLARSGGITPPQLFALYTEREPAASGGVWDRAEAIQSFDLALLAGDERAVARTLPEADRQMRSAGLEASFADFYGPRLARLPLRGSAQNIAERLVLLTSDAEGYADRIATPLYAAIAAGRAPETLPRDDFAAAIALAFAPEETPLSPGFKRLLDQGQFGEATLRALLILGRETADPDDVETALRVLRRLGFEQTARETALALLLDRDLA